MPSAVSSAEAEAAEARVARERPVEDRRRDRERGERDQQPGDEPDAHVERGRGAEHPRALGRARPRRHRPHRRAGDAVAQHQQVARQRRDEPVGAELGDRQPAREQRHDDQQHEQAAGLRDLLHERARREQPRLAAILRVLGLRNLGLTHGFAPYMPRLSPSTGGRDRLPRRRDRRAPSARIAHRPPPPTHQHRLESRVHDQRHSRIRTQPPPRPPPRCAGARCSTCPSR